MKRIVLAVAALTVWTTIASTTLAQPPGRRGGGAGGGVDEASQWVRAGSNVVVTASPNANYHFTGWSGATNGAAIVLDCEPESIVVPIRIRSGEFLPRLGRDPHEHQRDQRDDHNRCERARTRRPECHRKSRRRKINAATTSVAVAYRIE